MACGVRAWNFRPLMAMVPVVEPIFVLEILNDALAPPFFPTTAAVLSRILRASTAFCAVAVVAVSVASKISREKNIFFIRILNF